MKSSTEVWVAFRNIGDSTSQGEVMNGPLKDCMMWLMTRVGATTMATRISIGIGRDEAGARAAIETKRSGSRLDPGMFGDALERIFEGGESIDEAFSQSEALVVTPTPASQLDDWTPPA